jgi:hypothetical protein
MNIFYFTVVFLILYSSSAYVSIPFIRGRGCGENLTRGARRSTVHMTLLSYQGKKVEVKEGTPLSQACVKLGLKPKYDCKK